MNEEVQLTEKEMRQAEVDAYTKNISTYTSILSTLDGNWDADLIQFQNMDPHEAARLCSLDRIERLAELQFHKQISGLLRTEIVERFKAQSILNTLN